MFLKTSGEFFEVFEMTGTGCLLSSLFSLQETQNQWLCCYDIPILKTQNWWLLMLETPSSH
jgi:hypothetical protein